VIKAEKYPPSLAYLLMTLGPALVLLAFAPNWHGRVAGWLVTIGRVPLFFYVAHLYVAHVGAAVLAHAFGMGDPQIAGNPQAGGWGFDLPVVYAVWAAVVVALYPACRWFAGVKARRRDWWLSYL
jgi:hypothetical protein